jgi:hypothetical protein
MDSLEFAGKHDVKVHVIDTFEGSGMEHSGINLQHHVRRFYEEFRRLYSR